MERPVVADWGARAGTGRRRWPRLAVLTVLLPLCFAVPAVLAAYSDSASVGSNAFGSATIFGLYQPAGTAGCTSEDGTGGACVDGKGLLDAVNVVVSPDDKHVYTAAFASDAVGAFSRNVSTGVLTQLAGTAGCTSETGDSGACVNGVALDGAIGIAVSPGGEHVYATAKTSAAVLAFSRNSTTGALTQLAGTNACVSETGTSGSCVDGKGLAGANEVVVSPDGKHVYVAAEGGSVAAFVRNTSTGVLTQIAGTSGCYSTDGSSGTCVDVAGVGGARGIAISPNGATVYVGASGDSVAAFSRNSTTGVLTQLAGSAACIAETAVDGCTDGYGLDGPYGIKVSPDGLNVYVATAVTDGMALFSRNTTTGALTQLAGTSGCITESGTGGVCTVGSSVMNNAHSIAVSPDGENVYMSAKSDAAVTVFGRNAGTGALTLAPGTQGCITSAANASCLSGVGLNDARGLTVSPDGKDVYLLAATGSYGYLTLLHRDR